MKNILHEFGSTIDRLCEESVAEQILDDIPDMSFMPWQSQELEIVEYIKSHESMKHYTTGMKDREIKMVYDRVTKYVTDSCHR